MSTDEMWMPDKGVLGRNLAAVMGSLDMPQDYLVIDLETTGLNHDTDLIWQFGAFTCKDGKPKHERGTALYVSIPEAKAMAADFEIRKRAEKLVKVGATTWSDCYRRCAVEFATELMVKGKDLGTHLRTLIAAVGECERGGWPIVGQNCMSFDLPFIDRACRDVGMAFTFPRSRVVDTGLMIKAAKLKMAIGDGEDLQGFYRRVNSVRAKGCFFSIERFCVPAFKLVEKHGVEPDKAHDAGYDCYLTSLILRELVEWAKGG